MMYYVKFPIFYIISSFQSIQELKSTLAASTSTVFEQSPSHVNKETPLRRSSRSSSGESGNTLRKECIFCHTVKYQKGSNQREPLSSCMLLQADKRIRDIATRRNDSTT